MTPEQAHRHRKLLALQTRENLVDELVHFMYHPLNTKYNIVGASPSGWAVKIPALSSRDTVFSLAFLDSAYGFSAVLLQRLKDALADERYEVYDSFNPDVYRGTAQTIYMQFNGFEWETKTMIKAEASREPEVLCLLRAINDQWKGETE